ncbi:nitrate- and nitrite sensing domain-containing protein [Micromonospora sp. NPDC049559]|uniref:sensor histidine kinase n=1 Tax=Micromonospora sp. NPDC049559 TaxID=3155923 RepID=UPI00343AA420
MLTLVVIPLVSLVAVWGFATYVTVGDGLRLLNQGSLVTAVATPAEEILGALQGERRASVVFLVAPTGPNRATLIADRALVDQKITTYRTVLARADVRRITPDHVMALARGQLAALDRLPTLRSDVDGRRIATAAVLDRFRDLADPATPLYSAVSSFPDAEVSAEGRALQRLAHARELRARVDAILAGVLAAGDSFTRESYRQFVQALAVMRAEYHEAYVQLADPYRRELDALLAREPYVSLARMEDAAVATGGSGRIPVDAEQWRDANSAALAELAGFHARLGGLVERHAKSPAYLLFARALGIGLLGLIAVVVSVVISLRIGRRLADRLSELSSSAHALADTQLPAVVARLRRGERVDVDAEAPVLHEGRDEIGEVGDAFNSVRRTAISSAVEQAELRAGIQNAFSNIARRSQTLVKKQLSLLDVMEHKTVNPDELADLFKVDHLATRMRRYAENLLILGGERAGRSWGDSVPMQDVLRGAASEAEQYERVRVLPVPSVALAGVAVSDVIHLLAELIDNAATYSPPHTTVQVIGQQVAHGFVIEVEDRGLGMSEPSLEAANRWLSASPEFNVLALSESPRIGMFVVARIAARHDIRVTLRHSAYGGLTAIVLLPPRLVTDVEETPAGDATPPGPPAQVPPTRGREATAGRAVDTAAGRGREASAGRRAEATDGRAEAGDETVTLPVYQPVPAGAPVLSGGPAARDGVAAPSGGPAAGGAAGASAGGDQPRRTEQGLPVRVRQAGLAPGLRGPRPDPGEFTRSLPPRPPEEVRRMMSAYQHGTLRGRQASAEAAEASSTIDNANAAAADHGGGEETR